MSELILANNQKGIIIGSKGVCDQYHRYQLTNLDIRDMAMADLDGNCFKLWIYLQGNQEGYIFGLSAKELEKRGLKKQPYLRAVNTLIEKGYLVPCEIKPGLPGYRFEELPD